MSEQSDIILTPNSVNDDFLKRALDRRLWGYPKLVDACPFCVLADVRRQNLEEREKRAWSLPFIHLESATNVPEGQHRELPGGGDITRDPSLPPSLRKGQVSANENVHSDITDLHTYEAENHPEDDSVQSVT